MAAYDDSNAPRRMAHYSPGGFYNLHSVGVFMSPQEARRWLKKIIYDQPKVYDSDGLNDPNITVEQYAQTHKHQVLYLAMRQEFGVTDIPEKLANESEDAYERRMIMWKAEKESRRAEAQKDKAAVLHTAVAAILLAFADAWGVGILCFLGFDHAGIVVPGILTGVALVAAAIVLLVKHSDMRVPE